VRCEKLLLKSERHWFNHLSETHLSIKLFKSYSLYAHNIMFWPIWSSSGVTIVVCWKLMCFCYHSFSLILYSMWSCLSHSDVSYVLLWLLLMSTQVEWWRWWKGYQLALGQDLHSFEQKNGSNDLLKENPSSDLCL
jgi:hypothetical protein